eukprot:1153663-Prorocentrum_minimum.AAC.1
MTTINDAIGKTGVAGTEYLTNCTLTSPKAATYADPSSSDGSRTKTTPHPDCDEHRTRVQLGIQLALDTLEYLLV